MQVRQVDRRAVRRRMLADRDFHRLDGRMKQVSDQFRVPELREYLYSANAEILEVDSSYPIRGRAAFFADLVLLHLRLPKVVISWNRDHASRDRALIALARQGSIDLVSDAPILRRDPTAYLVTPHELPVTIRVLEQGGEFVFLSIPARHVHTVLPDCETAAVSTTGPLSSALLSPMYSFVTGLCALSTTEVKDASPLRSAAEEIVRSTLRLIAATDGVGEQSLYGAACRLILNEYTDPSFGVAELARRLKVATRTVQATFQAEHTTVTATLREVRGAAARRVLREQPRLTKAKVAKLAGFGSVDALDRVLRAHDRDVES